MELINLKDVLIICSAYCPDDDGSCSKAGHDLREMLDEIEGLPIVHIDDMTFNIQNEIQAKKPSRTVEITFVRHGRWIETRYCPVGDTMYCDCNCSICNFEITKERGFYPRFCENCGTRMDLRTPTEVQLDEADSVMMGEVEE